MVWQGHILSSDIGLVFGLVLIGHWAGFGLVLIGHWAGFVTQTWQPWVCPTPLALVGPLWAAFWLIEQVDSVVEPVSKSDHSDWWFS